MRAIRATMLGGECGVIWGVLVGVWLVMIWVGVLGVSWVGGWGSAGQLVS